MAKKKNPSEIETSLDLKAVVFDGDRDLRESLLSDKAFLEAYNTYQALPDGPSARRNLLLTAMRLTPRIAPALFDCVEACTKTLGITAHVEVYCSQNAELNAFVIPPQAGRLCIGFSSSALERFDDDELRFILGHEFGHALYQHHLMSSQILDVGGDELSPLHSMRYYAWKRYAELTADRVGLLVSKDLNTAIRTFFKLTSGLTDRRWITGAIDAAMEHAIKEASEIETSQDTDEWFSTHPYSPLRVKALELFSRSRTYYRLLGKEGGELTEKKLEESVATIIDLMNPSVLNEKSGCVKETREFLAHAGLAIALADNKAKKSELEAIKKLIGEGKLAESITTLKAMSEEDRNAKITELSAVLRVKLSPNRRAKVIEDLCTVAAADAKIAAEEFPILYALADVLGLNPGLVDVVLQNLQQELD